MSCPDYTRKKTIENVDYCKVYEGCLNDEILNRDSECEKCPTGKNPFKGRVPEGDEFVKVNKHCADDSSSALKSALDERDNDTDQGGWGGSASFVSVLVLILNKTPYTLSHNDDVRTYGLFHSTKRISEISPWGSLGFLHRKYDGEISAAVGAVEYKFRVKDKDWYANIAYANDF